jgi:hypothetical protein
MFYKLVNLSIVGWLAVSSQTAVAADKPALPPADWVFSPDAALKREAELFRYLDQLSEDPKDAARAREEMPQKLAAKKTEPAWIKKTSSIERAQGKEVRFGVGTVSGIKNRSLARSTAENRARTEIAKLKSVTIEQATDANGGKVVKTMTVATLSGVEIVDWYEAPDGTWYALAMQVGD